VQTSDFHYELPPDLIAQHPAQRRDESRLLVLQRSSGEIAHRRFPDLLHYLRAGEVLILNNSKVIPARLRGSNARTGGEFELLLVEENDSNDWWAMIRPGKRARVGTKINLHDLNGASTGITAIVLAVNEEGHRRIQFTGTKDILDNLPRLGEIPLPPYIKRSSRADLAEDLERYQTIYAQPRGSVAAPTAGLHFTPELLERIRAIGVRICYVTLHVGLATFAPVKTDHIEQHVMHEERYQIPADTAAAINEAKSNGRRVVAVGTTSARVLESQAKANEIASSEEATFSSPFPLNGEKAGVRGKTLPVSSNLEGSVNSTIIPGSGKTKIFIYPPYQFRIVDALLTNFHLPSSTLLMLVSAFASPGKTRGRDLVLSAYREAIRVRYRFFSYGDAMFVE